MENRRTFTRSMAWLHTWSGLLIGWMLFAIFLTGTLAVFDKEFNWWMQPELGEAPRDPVAAANVAQAWLERHHPDETEWAVSLPTERTPALSVSTGERRRGDAQWLDAQTGEPLEARDTAGGNFFFHFHYTLHLPRTLGAWTVGFAAMAMLVALVSGIVIHKKIFKEFFTFRPRKGQRSWLDGHNASAVLMLPFHLMITYTGLVIFAALYMPAALQVLYDGDRQALMRDAQGGGAPQVAEAGGRAPAAGTVRGEGRGQGEAPGRERPASAAPPARLLPLGDFVAKGEAWYGAGKVAGLGVSNPGRADAVVTVRPLLGSRLELTKGEGMTFNAVTGELLQSPPPSRTSLLTQRVLVGLHFAQFGGYPMRWLYFLCGLASCAMIATGLVLYTVKKRKLVDPDEIGARRGLRLVEALNVAAVAGLSLACVALLWANLLLPVELAQRADWEVALFFAVWLASLLHAGLRDPLRAWREQLFALALACLALPLTDLGHAMDGIRLGLDVAAVAVGAALVAAALKVPAARAAADKAPPAASYSPPVAGAQK